MKENSHDNDVKMILEWEAPGRPYSKKGRQFFLTVILLTLLVETILFIFGQYLMMVVVLSLVFLSFSLVMVPPKDFRYRVSSEGLQVEDKYFLWEELYDFYFKKTENQEVLHVRTKAFLPGELVITLGDKDQGDVKKAFLHFLPFREYVKPTFMDKSGEWLARNFPLENKK